MNDGDNEMDLRKLPILKPLPGEVIIRAPKGVKPAGRTNLVHGYHCNDAIEIPTSLTCNVCPLYAVKRKDRRHRLACPEGRKNQVCPILTQRQITWAEEFIQEIWDGTGEGPSATDRGRIEQIVRHRSRVWQVENYLKVAGYLDLKKGEFRNVSERLTTLENALARSFSEFRQSIAERRINKPGGPTLDKYLEVRAKEEGDGKGDD